MLKKGMEVRMSRGRRYTKEKKLNIKKVVAVLIAIAVTVMFCYAIKKLVKVDNNTGTIVQTSYFPVYTNDKWGVIDSNGQVIIESNYDEMILIPNSKKDVFICVTNVDYNTGKYSTKAINSKNEEIFKDYEEVLPIENYDKNNTLWYEEDVLKVKKDGKYGLIDYSGKEILKTEYDEIKSIKGTTNSLLISKDNKYGLADNLGNIVIKTEYTNIKAISENYKSGYIVIDENGKQGVIDFDGKVVLANVYEDIKQIDLAGMYVVKQDAIWKLIDKTTKTILENNFDEIKEVNGDNIVYVKDKKYGVKNKAGADVLQASYDNLSYTFSSYYIAKKDNQYGVIKLEENETVLGFEYSKIEYVKGADIFEAEKNSSANTFIINNAFEQKLEGIISEINVNGGYMRVRVNGEYKFYNFKFEEKSAADCLTLNNLFLSKKNGKYGYCDKNGNVVVDYIYDDATEQNKYGYCAVKKDGAWGSLDSKGNVVATPAYNLENNLLIDFIGKWHVSQDLNAYYYTNQ